MAAADEGVTIRARIAAWIPRRTVDNAGEDGFSMVEVVVTITILSTLVLSMSVALANGFKFLLTSKQRAAATQAANAQIERARAVAQNDWTQLGLVSSDLAGDSNIAAGACGAGTASMFSGEPIVVAGSAGSNPLYPHVQTLGVGSTQVTLRTYVTGLTASGACSASTPSYKRVTVLASWAKGQAGIPSSIKLSTFVTPTSRAANPDFSGTSSYSGSSLLGVFGAAGAASQTTGIYPPQSASDGRSVGQIVTYKGTGIAALATVNGASTSQHTASAVVDDDSLTTAIPKHACDPSSCQPPTPPNCSTFSGTATWSDYLGGLIGSTAQSAAGSCSSVTDASDGLPYTKNRGQLNSALTMRGTVPAGGILPAFVLDLAEAPSGWSATSIVDRSVTGGQARLASTATTTLAASQMLRFTVAGVVNANRGVVEFAGGTFTAQANAGAGAAAPTATGVMTFALFDPGSVLTGCASRSGSYCIVNVDPSAAGFSGFDQTYNVTVNFPSSIAPTARFIMSTNVKVFVPSKTQSVSSGTTTQATMGFALPKVTTSLIVQAPVGVTLATASDTVDYGQLVATAFYAAP